MLDVVIQEMDGLQMIMEMNKLMEEDERPPIIGISGGGERMPGWYAVQMVEMLGGRSVLSKPFSVDELRTAISEALEKKLLTRYDPTKQSHQGNSQIRTSIRFG